MGRQGARRKKGLLERLNADDVRELDTGFDAWAAKRGYELDSFRPGKDWVSCGSTWRSRSVSAPRIGPGTYNRYLDSVELNRLGRTWVFG
jgi:hypothetical protein